MPALIASTAGLAAYAKACSIYAHSTTCYTPTAQLTLRHRHGSLYAHSTPNYTPTARLTIRPPPSAGSRHSPTALNDGSRQAGACTPQINVCNPPPIKPPSHKCTCMILHQMHVIDPSPPSYAPYPTRLVRGMRLTPPDAACALFHSNPFQDECATLAPLVCSCCEYIPPPPPPVSRILNRRQIASPAAGSPPTILQDRTATLLQSRSTDREGERRKERERREEGARDRPETGRRET